MSIKTNADKTYRIERDCCTSGNCIECKHLPYGRKIRVEHLTTDDKTIAVLCVVNYTLYNAKLTRGTV